MGYEMLHEGDLLISHYNNIYKIGRMLGVGGQGFCDKMGLGNEARESAVEILMRTFIL